MGRFSKYVIAFVTFAVLVVLITPALDELPCTTVHKSPVLVALAGIPLLVLPVFSAAKQLIVGMKESAIVDDLCSLTCTFLC